MRGDVCTRVVSGDVEPWVENNGIHPQDSGEDVGSSAVVVVVDASPSVVDGDVWLPVENPNAWLVSRVVDPWVVMVDIGPYVASSAVDHSGMDVQADEQVESGNGGGAYRIAPRSTHSCWRAKLGSNK